jgi:hypothetical protein
MERGGGRDREARACECECEQEAIQKESGLGNCSALLWSGPAQCSVLSAHCSRIINKVVVVVGL